MNGAPAAAGQPERRPGPPSPIRAAASAAQQPAAYPPARRRRAAAGRRRQQRCSQRSQRAMLAIIPAASSPLGWQKDCRPQWLRCRLFGPCRRGTTHLGCPVHPAGNACRRTPRLLQCRATSGCWRSWRRARRASVTAPSGAAEWVLGWVAAAAPLLGVFLTPACCPRRPAPPNQPPAAWLQLWHGQCGRPAHAQLDRHHHRPAQRGCCRVLAALGGCWVLLLASNGCCQHSFGVHQQLCYRAGSCG